MTERCVFQLTPKGLKLIEVYPGVDVQQDILAQIPFEENCFIEERWYEYRVEK